MLNKQSLRHGVLCWLHIMCWNYTLAPWKPCQWQTVDYQLCHDEQKNSQVLVGTLVYLSGRCDDRPLGYNTKNRATATWMLKYVKNAGFITTSSQVKPIETIIIPKSLKVVMQKRYQDVMRHMYTPYVFHVYVIYFWDPCVNGFESRENVRCMYNKQTGIKGIGREHLAKKQMLS